MISYSEIYKGNKTNEILKIYLIAQPKLKKNWKAHVLLQTADQWNMINDHFWLITQNYFLSSETKIFCFQHESEKNSG